MARTSSFLLAKAQAPPLGEEKEAEYSIREEDERKRRVSRGLIYQSCSADWISRTSKSHSFSSVVSTLALMDLRSDHRVPREGMRRRGPKSAVQPCRCGQLHATETKEHTAKDTGLARPGGGRGRAGT